MRRRNKGLRNAEVSGIETSAHGVGAGLEAGWAGVRYMEGFFQGEADFGQLSLSEELPNEGDAVGDAARRGEARQGMGGVGRPVAAGLGDLNEAGADGE